MFKNIINLYRFINYILLSRGIFAAKRTHLPKLQYPAPKLAHEKYPFQRLLANHVGLLLQRILEKPPPSNLRRETRRPFKNHPFLSFNSFLRCDSHSSHSLHLLTRQWHPDPTL